MMSKSFNLSISKVENGYILRVDNLPQAQPQAVFVFLVFQDLVDWLRDNSDRYFKKERY